MFKTIHVTNQTAAVFEVPKLSFDTATTGIHMYPELYESPHGVTVPYSPEEIIDNFSLIFESSMIFYTISEHFILCLQKGIRDGDINSSDVLIYQWYMESTGEIQNNKIDINDNGDFETPWKNGYFTERIKLII